MQNKLFTWLSVVIIATGFIFQNGFTKAVEDINQTQTTNGQYVTSISSGSGDQILWDLTHGVHTGYEPFTYFSKFIRTLQNHGHTINTTTDIGAEDLLQFKMLIICVGSAWNSSYTNSEALKIRRFVENGGGVLIMSDNPNCPNENINPVAQQFGITCGTSALSQDDLFITNLSGHFVFTDISEIYFHQGGALNVTSPGEAIAWDNDKPAVAVFEQGAGHVLATGDMDSFKDSFFQDWDPSKLLDNYNEWLATAPLFLLKWDNFDFDDGNEYNRKQSWTLEGGFEYDGTGGPLSSTFFDMWHDGVEYPQAPGYNPIMNDNKGSFAMGTLHNGHGINVTGDWWLMQLKSPSLHFSDTWQEADGYTAEIAVCMGAQPDIFANLYVEIYDYDEEKLRRFYSGDAIQLEHDFYGDVSAHWNHLTLNWFEAENFPEDNYTIKKIYINIWGKADQAIGEGGLYLDEVIPFVAETPVDLPEDWEFEDMTGNNATVILPLSVNPSIDGIPLKNGDYIGVFTPNGLCGGNAEWQEQNLSITIWGDNDNTTNVDGFKSNELIKYRVYRPSEAKEWTSVAVEYSSGTGNYSANAIMELSEFNVQDTKTFTTTLYRGWNLISSNVEPQDPNIETMMTSVADKLVIMKNFAGQVYNPAYNINTIETFNFKECYFVNTSTTTGFSISGYSVAVDTPIPLSAGWSGIAYLPQTAMDVSTALSSIYSKIFIVKNNNGETYLPAYGIDQIGQMQPGQGYMINMYTAGTLEYPDAASAMDFINSKNSDAKKFKKAGTIHFQFTRNTGGSTVVLLLIEIEPQYSDRKPLNIGDEIGVFNASGKCCGATVWQNVNTAITVWGDDIQTKEIDGFKPDEKFQLRVWRRDDNTEYPVNVIFSKDHSQNYQENGFSILSTFQADLSFSVSESKPAEFKLLQNYPNPFNPSTVIRYQLPEEKPVRITVYNSMGQQIRQLISEMKSAGYHEIEWDGTDDNNRIVPSGIYFYRIDFGESYRLKKCLLLK